MYRINFLTIALLICVVGCGGGSGDNVMNNPPPTYGPAVLAGALEDRLGPAPAAVQSGLAGRVTISGLTVIDDQSQLVQPNNQGAELDLRLVDPEDDILSEIVPGPDGRFSANITAGTPHVKFKVGFSVQEDLDGDGLGDERIELSIPVELVDGLSADISLDLNRAAEEDLDLGLLPDMGVVLIVELVQLDGYGSHEELYGVFFADGSVIFDTDGDNVLEHGDDKQGLDQDSNGWPDNEEDNYKDITGNPVYIEGLIASVDIGEQTMNVRIAYAEEQLAGGPQVLAYLDGSILTVIKDSFVSQESLLLGDAPVEDGSLAFDSTNLSGSGAISDRLIGHEVAVLGSLAGNELRANWIVVIE